MFGVEPDLLCARCASGVRQRMQVRFRPVAKDRAPIATVVCVGIAVLLALATELMWPMRGTKPRPGWLLLLYQTQDVWAGEVWRHVTSMFLHGGWVHLVFNGMALWSIGRIFEATWGALAMLGLLILTGIAGASLEFIAHQSSSVGLSGGILGLCGFLIALRHRHPVAAAVMHPGNVKYVLVFVVVCIVASLANVFNIANWAHGGGLGLGFLIGHASLDPRRRILVPLCGLLAVGLMVASIFLAFGSVQVTRDGGANWERIPRMEWREIWLKQNGR